MIQWILYYLLTGLLLECLTLVMMNKENRTKLLEEVKDPLVIGLGVLIGVVIWPVRFVYLGLELLGLLIKGVFG